MADIPNPHDKDLSTLDVMFLNKIDLRFYGGEVFYIMRSFPADDPAPRTFSTRIFACTSGKWTVHSFPNLAPGHALSAITALCDMILPTNLSEVSTSSPPFHVPRESFQAGSTADQPPDELFTFMRPGCTGSDEQVDTAERELITKYGFPNGWKGIRPI